MPTEILRRGHAALLKHAHADVGMALGASGGAIDVQ
jgi:hypothetical protein